MPTVDELLEREAELGAMEEAEWRSRVANDLDGAETYAVRASELRQEVAILSAQVNGPVRLVRPLL